MAEVSCGHDQHVRHRPPFQLREWVIDAVGRDSRVGTPIECSLCERAEVPLGLRPLWSTPVWDEISMPRGLLRAHKNAPRTWGRIVVQDGRLRINVSTKPTIEIILSAREVQDVPPDVLHEMHPEGPVHFSVQFLAIDREVSDVAQPTLERTGYSKSATSGDDVNVKGWAKLVCPGCGILLDDCPHG